MQRRGQRVDSAWRKSRLAARLLLRKETGPLYGRKLAASRRLSVDPEVSNRLIQQGLYFLGIGERKEAFDRKLVERQNWLDDTCGCVAGKVYRDVAKGENVSVNTFWFGAIAIDVGSTAFERGHRFVFGGRRGFNNTCPERALGQRAGWAVFGARIRIELPNEPTLAATRDYGAAR